VKASDTSTGKALRERVDFTRIRYAQCWEDADVLLRASNLAPGDSCLSVASAGDNTLALLSLEPRELVALDINPAQLACLALRVAACKTLNHAEYLVFMGSRPGGERIALYRRCRGQLSPRDRDFWDARSADIERGLGAIGRFENYFSLFRRYLLPLIHNPGVVAELIAPATARQRRGFYRQTWNSWRWRLLFRLFFSRFVMGRMGRDPELFRYVRGSVSERILDRTRHALTDLDPARNPYLCWILYGRHHDALPFALRAENFDAIRDNLGRLHWHCASLADYLGEHPRQRFDAFNLSDIFEYTSAQEYTELLGVLIGASRPGTRLVYWNMLADRSRPAELAERLRPLQDLATQLHAQDKAFFYSRLVIEEVQA
jgi:S-adenosylmethionine-diacylglycerol 3-amino-3-carboxypropyl transferase